MLSESSGSVSGGTSLGSGFGGSRISSGCLLSFVSFPVGTIKLGSRSSVDENFGALDGT